MYNVFSKYLSGLLEVKKKTLTVKHQEHCYYLVAEGGCCELTLISVNCQETINIVLSKLHTWFGF